MARCETSHLGAIPCLVSCLLQRMLHSNVKMFSLIFKKMGKESTRAAELLWRVIVCLFFGQKHKIKRLTHQKAVSDLRIIDQLSVAGCCIVFFSKHKHEKTNHWKPL